MSNRQVHSSNDSRFIHSRVLLRYQNKWDFTCKLNSDKSQPISLEWGKIFTHKLVSEATSYLYHKHQTNIFKFLQLMKNVFIVFKWCCFLFSLFRYLFFGRLLGLVWKSSASMNQISIQYCCRLWWFGLLTYCVNKSSNSRQMKTTSSFVINYKTAFAFESCVSDSRRFQ